jgi:uncharacterized protein
VAALPANVKEAWENREGPIVLTTVSGDGIPNAIYATCVSLFGDDAIVVANNYFAKTMENIKAGSNGSVLFKTAEGKAYQVKGKIEYTTDGPVFEDMKKWNPEKHPGHGATAIKVEAVFSGSEKLL